MTINIEDLNIELLRSIASLSLETLAQYDDEQLDFIDCMESIAYWERHEELTSQALNEQFWGRFPSWDAYMDAVTNCITYLTVEGLDELKKLAGEAQ
jgi:hypothetical protein